MEARSHHLAQLNIARMRVRLDDPSMYGFTSRIAEINQLAESSPGFVWRWTEPDNGPFTAPDLLFNLSVWESVEALHAYVYRSGHVEVFRDHAQWFLPHNGPSLALWWIPAGLQPTPQESKERLDSLSANGPTSFAFTFRDPFTQP